MVAKVQTGLNGGRRPMERRTHCGLIGAMAASIVVSAAFAADWPTWRYDAGRTGYSPDGLPEKIRLQWSRKLPPVTMAWPYTTNLKDR